MSEFEHWRPRYRRTHPASRRSGGSGIQTRTRLAPDRISFLVKLSVRRNVRVGGLNLLEFEGGLGSRLACAKKIPATTTREPATAWRHSSIGRHGTRFYRQPTRVVTAAEEGVVS